MPKGVVAWSLFLLPLFGYVAQFMEFDAATLKALRRAAHRYVIPGSWLSFSEGTQLENLIGLRPGLRDPWWDKVAMLLGTGIRFWPGWRKGSTPQLSLARNQLGLGPLREARHGSPWR